MKIQALRNSDQSFSQKWHIFCYDDAMSKQTREYIREHLEEQFQNSEIINSGRLSEYELNQLIKSLILNKPQLKAAAEQNPEINEELLQTAGFSNLQNLYGDNSYRASLNNISQEQIRIARQAGVRRIVDLREWKDNTESEDIEYLYFPISLLLFDNSVLNTSEENYIKKQMKYTMYDADYSENKRSQYIEQYRQNYQREKREFNKQFVEFIQTMQKGNVLIGCEYGTEFTDNALCLDFFFNPKADIERPDCRKSFGATMQAIYENLSQEDKEALGWDEEFDNNFIQSLERYGFWIF